MRVVVTGGSGFIGSALSLGLNKAGVKVLVLDRVRPAVDDVEFAVVDLLEPELAWAEMRAWSEEPIDAVLHLAGPVADATRKQIAAAADLQVRGTLHALEAVRRLQIPRFVLASSFYVYAGMPEDAILNESTAIDIRRLEPFGAVKLLSERLVEAYGTSYGLEWAILRFGSAYGWSPSPTGSNVIRTFLELGALGQPIEVWGRGVRRNQYTLLDDIVRGTIRVLDGMPATAGEIWNLISPEETTTGALARHVAARYGYDVLFNPDRAEGPSMAYMSSRKATRVLGWQPTGLEEGIEWTRAHLGLLIPSVRSS